MKCGTLLHPDTGDQWRGHSDSDCNTHDVHQDAGEGKATFTRNRGFTDFVLRNILPADKRQNDWACGEQDDGTKHHPVSIRAEGAERVHGEVCEDTGSCQEGAIVHRCKRKDCRDEVADTEAVVLGLQR